MTEAQESLLRAATVCLNVDAPGEAVEGTGFVVARGVVATCAHVLGASRTDLPVPVSGQIVVTDQELRLEAVPEWYLRDTAEGLDLAFLRVLGAEDVPGVLLSPVSRVGDEMWTFGHPAGRFRNGQSALFTYQGPSLLEPVGKTNGAARADWMPGRVVGTPVGGGYSGSAVLNRATGAVAGMLCSSDKAGSAHMVSADELIRALTRLPEQDVGSLLPHAPWLDTLDDDQMVVGGWRYPRPSLRKYLDLAARAAVKHPFPGAVPDIPHPSLTAVYVRQQAASPAAATGSADERPQASDRRPAEDLLELGRDCVLVAGAGAGKSSFFRRSQIAFEERWRAEAMAPAIPVRVQAVDLAKHHLIPEAIAASVVADLSQVGLTGALRPEFFASPPVPGIPWLVLVDGLDEITDAGQRTQVLDKIAGIGAQGLDPLYRFVVATRPLPTGELERADWDVDRFVLEPFRAIDLPEFARRWFVVLRVPDPEDMTTAFIDELRHRRLTELARTPLMATMLCQLYAHSPDQALPGGRYRVYERFVDLLQQRQREGRSGIYPQIDAAFAKHGPAARTVAATVLDDGMSLIERLAAERRAGARRSAVTLLSEWTDKRRPTHVSRETWASFLAELLRRSGLLIERSGDFVFLHQTIRDYLAAHHAVRDQTSRAMAFEALLGPGYRSSSARRKFPSPPRESDSFPGFLIAAGQEDQQVVNALHRLALRGGVEWCTFIALGAADKTPLPQRVVDAAIGTLTRYALNPERSSDELWMAAAMLGNLDRGKQAEMLVTLGTRSAVPLRRRWEVVNELATLGSDRLTDACAPLVRDINVPPMVRWGAATLAARSTAPEGAGLLAELLADSKFQRFEAVLKRRRESLAARQRRRQAVRDQLWRLVPEVRWPRSLRPRRRRQDRRNSRRARWSISKYIDKYTLARSRLGRIIKALSRRLFGAWTGERPRPQSIAVPALPGLSQELDRLWNAQNDFEFNAIVDRVIDITTTSAVHEYFNPAQSEHPRKHPKRGPLRLRDASVPAGISSIQLMAAAGAGAASTYARVVFNVHVEHSERLSALAMLADLAGLKARDLLAALAGATSVPGEERLWFARNLTTFGDSRAVSLLEGLARDEHTAIRARIDAAGYLSADYPETARRLRSVVHDDGCRDILPSIAPLLIGLGDSRAKDALAVLARTRHAPIDDRIYSAKTLAELGDSRGRDALAHLIRSKGLTRRDRRVAAEALDDAGDLRGTIRLADMAIKTADESTLRAAHGRLMRAPGAVAAGQLAAFAAARSVPGTMRWQSAWHLAKGGDPRGVRLLAALAIDRRLDLDDRKSAAGKLVSLPGDAVTDRCAALATTRGADSRIRLAAVGRLVKVRDARASGCLAILAADEKAEVRVRLKAAAKLASARDSRASELLCGIVRHPSAEEHERLVAARILFALDAEQGVAAFTNLAADESLSDVARSKAAMLLSDASQSQRAD